MESGVLVFVSLTPQPKGAVRHLNLFYFILCHWKVLRAQSYFQLVLYELKQAGNTHFVVFLYLRKRWQWKVCNFCPHEEQVCD